MKIDMDDSRIQSIAHLAGFLNGAPQLVVSLERAAIEEKYRFIDRTIDRFRYANLKRNERYTVYRYLRNVTGYQESPAPPAHQAGGCRKTHQEGISKGQFHPVYRNNWVNHTKARLVPIGRTQAPENYGRPGSIRVDTVSQRDIYHINAVDEITQWEILVAVPVISEVCMLPALSILLDQFPFTIFNVHSDRGGEAINYLVASVLQKLLITQTKSRVRHPNDNALVETKNGSVVRKNMG